MYVTCLFVWAPSYLAWFSSSIISWLAPTFSQTPNPLKLLHVSGLPRPPSLGWWLVLAADGGLLDTLPEHFTAHQWYNSSCCFAVTHPLWRRWHRHGLIKWENEREGGGSKVHSECTSCNVHYKVIIFCLHIVIYVSCYVNLKKAGDKSWKNKWIHSNIETKKHQKRGIRKDCSITPTMFDIDINALTNAIQIQRFPSPLMSHVTNMRHQ